MGYATFKSSPKTLTTSESIGTGQVKMEHLDPGLFGDIQSIKLHNHSGTKSRKVKMTDIDGAFGVNGFYMYSTTGVRYHVTIDAGGAFVLTAG